MSGKTETSRFQLGRKVVLADAPEGVVVYEVVNHGLYHEAVFEGDTLVGYLRKRSGSTLIRGSHRTNVATHARRNVGFLAFTAKGQSAGAFSDRAAAVANLMFGGG